MAVNMSPLSELHLAGYIVATHLRSAMELRRAFGLQIIGMMVNNTAFVVIWLFFFQVFGTIYGWSSLETIGLQGFVALVYGLAFTIGSGILHLPSIVDNGSFDALLLSPRNLYLGVITSKCGVSSIGDIFFGIVLIVTYLVMASASWQQVLLLITLLLPATMIVLNCALITSLLAFLLPNSTSISKSLFDIFFSPSMYPSGLFQGGTRFLFLFVIPSLAIAGIPIEVVRDVDLKGWLIVWGLGIFWTCLGIKLLTLAVKKYESGNLVGARTS